MACGRTRPLLATIALQTARMGLICGVGADITSDGGKVISSVILSPKDIAPVTRPPTNGLSTKRVTITGIISFKTPPRRSDGRFWSIPYQVNCTGQDPDPLVNKAIFNFTSNLPIILSFTTFSNTTTTSTTTTSSCSTTTSTTNSTAPFSSNPFGIPTYSLQSLFVVSVIGIGVLFVIQKRKLKGTNLNHYRHWNYGYNTRVQTLCAIFSFILVLSLEDLLLASDIKDLM